MARLHTVLATIPAVVAAMLAAPVSAGPEVFIQASINHGPGDYVEGVGFPDGAEPTVTIRDGGDVVFDAEGITTDQGRFGFSPMLDLVPGMEIEVSDPDTGVTKTLTLVDLTVDDVDANSNTVVGSGPPGGLLRTFGYSCGAPPPEVELTIPANGQWTADFSGMGGIDAFTDMGATHVFDEDGDNTIVSSPFRLEVVLDSTAGVASALTHNPDDSFTTIPARTIEVTVSNGESSTFGPVTGDPHDPVNVPIDVPLTPGMVVTVRDQDTGFASELTVQPLSIDSVDADGVARGTGPPGTTLELRLTDGTVTDVDVAADGSWEATLGGPADGATLTIFECDLDAQTATFAAEGPQATPGTTRLAGPERIATTVSISQDLWADGSAAVVVIARHDNYPDSLSGSALAAALGGPLLLTPSHLLWEDTADEIARVLAPGGTVWLLGGEAALSADVASDAADRGFDTMRAQGPTRYDTSVAIAEATTDNPATIFLAEGNDFPEALIAGAAAAQTGGVLVLTNSDILPDPVADYLSAHPDVPQYAVGGTAAQAALGAEAIDGADQYENSRLVADRFYDGPSGVAIASGENFPDGLAGGAHAGVLGFPLLLSPRDGLPPAASAYLEGHAPFASIYLYGGEAALAPAVAEAVLDFTE